MAITFAADLAAIKQDVLTDLFYAGLSNRRFIQNLAVFHDVRGANGDTLKFPVVPALTAVQAADSVATTYQTVTPTSTSATIVELHTAVGLSRFAQETSPIKSANQLAESMMAALADGLENMIVDEAVAGPADEVGADGSPLELADLRAALAVLGANRQHLAGWLLNATGEGNLLSIAELSNASMYGNPGVIQDGQIAKLYGGPVFVSPHVATLRSALVARNTLHYGIASENPEIDIVYDPDVRADKAVARLSVAVKYVPQENSKGVRIRHSGV